MRRPYIFTVAGSINAPYHRLKHLFGSPAITSRLPQKIQVGLALGILLLVALCLRLLLLSGPQTELEADEAIVGLMARHILQGERPIFYWMQPYMGSLEAYLAAGVFALIGSSTFALKLVPLTFALLFVVLVFITGYRIGGLKVAIGSGLYIAVPPAFLALWSLKARGGYIEILVIGQLMILNALEVARAGRVNLRSGATLGLLSGLGLWINPLIGVYIIPTGLYLALSLRKDLVGRWLLAAALAAFVGAFPLISYNLANGLATATSMLGGESISPVEILRAVGRFFRYCIPILAGFSQASSSPALFWPAFHGSPGASPLLLPLCGSLFVLILVQPIRRLFSCIAARDRCDGGRELLALLVIVVPAVFAVSKFRELVTEPRYLLPLYSAVPLFVAGIFRPRPPWRPQKAGPGRATVASVASRPGGVWGVHNIKAGPGRSGLGCPQKAGPGRSAWRGLGCPQIPTYNTLLSLIAVAIVALNLYSVAALDPRLNLPDTAVGSNRANRLELAEFLLSRGLTYIYTDYWLAYPLAFESEEQIVPSVISGGYNRYTPYAHHVSVAPNPAFVFITDSKEETSFLTKLMERQVEVRSDRVGIYSVYWQVTPIDRARP